jgi:polysaccharide export outer membrane protein
MRPRPQWSGRFSGGVVRKGLRLLVLASAAMALAFAQGCAKRLPPQAPDAGRIEAPPPPAPAVGENEPAPPEQEKPAPGRLVPVQSGRQVGARISTYYLSSGDEIRVSVLGSADLSRVVRIPPDGHIFFPMVGDIGVDGMSIPELRQIIADKLRTADEQRIGTGDQVSVRVYRNDDLSITTIVPSSGRVNLPLGGEVELTRLTVEEANQAIAKKLLPYVVRPSVSTTILKSASGMPGRISDPQVSVEVMAFGGHKILVLGEVENPGVYVNEGGSRLLEIVARAGGPTKDAKMKNVALIRPATETSPARTAVVDLDRAIRNGDLNQNPPVQRGDVIYVPKTTIAKLAQFFEQVYAIVRPFVVIETGIWLGENIEAGARSQTPSPIVFQ